MKIRMVLPSMLAMFVVAVPVKAADGPDPSIMDIATKVNAEGEFAGAFDTLLAAVLVADPAVLETLSGYGRYAVCTDRCCICRYWSYGGECRRASPDSIDADSAVSRRARKTP